MQSSPSTFDCGMCDFGHCSSTDVLDVPPETTIAQSSLDGEEFGRRGVLRREKDVMWMDRKLVMENNCKDV